MFVFVHDFVCLFKRLYCNFIISSQFFIHIKCNASLVIKLPRRIGDFFRKVFLFIFISFNRLNILK